MFRIHLICLTQTIPQKMMYVRPDLIRDLQVSPEDVALRDVWRSATAGFTDYSSTVIGDVDDEVRSEPAAQKPHHLS